MNTRFKKALLFGGLIAGAAFLIACSGASSSSDGKSMPTIPNPTTAGSAVVQANAKPAPVAADFTLTGKVKSQQCFGSAGCNVEVDPELVYVGKGAQPNSSWEITYNVTGDESGVITNTLTVTFDETGAHGSYEVDTIFASTKARKDVPLTFVITSITSTNG